jgi:hypothetical protein
MERPEVEPLVLPAKMFADAWLNVWGATGADKKHPWTYRKMYVEVFPEDGVRLVATDSYLLFRSFVPLEKLVDEDGPAYDEPPVTELPSATLVVVDRDQQALALLGYVAKPTEQDKAKDGPLRSLVLSVDKMDDEYQPRLGGPLDVWGAMFATPDHRLLVELSEDEPVNWRSVAETLDAQAVDAVAFSARNMRGLARLAQAAGESGLEMRSTGPNKPIMLTANCTPRVLGLAMPLSRGQKPPPVDEDDDEPDETDEPARVRHLRSVAEEAERNLRDEGYDVDIEVTPGDPDPFIDWGDEER